MSSIKAKAVMYSSYGDPSSVINIHNYNIDLTNLKSDEIIMQTLASPINPSDINQIQGVYPSKPPLTTELGTSEPSAVAGNEGLFKVIAIGNQVSKFQIGDWCIPSGANFGTWRTHAISNESNLIKLPNDSKLSLNQAATITVNPSSAYQMLTYYIDLKPGDWFIQNGGNSQVGKAAIQIGKKLGLNSISIVRNRPDLDVLKNELYELGATKVITEDENSDKEFGKVIKEWTKGKPIKLGLNSIGGSNLTNMARKLGHDAMLLTYGGMSMKPVSLPTSLFIFKNLTAKGFWVTENIKRIPGSREDTINKLLQFIEDGDFKDVVNFEIDLNLNELTDDDLLNAFKKGLKDSSKGKQIVKFT
ncbi:hypothetical protein CANARDRAFT_29798 [[Candida] arabinofermentans NRRL YB-2248]|uniref:enoyl-[acyl-carrier-protein] reductase n=1 Tax=[Candida] arabinofermentans NRRL YB-2248 TaxID=983967 RepID=A0A1E4SVN5_9ASCO|nr:hypothetical protein CANARDRAFT_29798 [[Candida] arabinofermentans NRRL YB-2248]